MKTLALVVPSLTNGGGVPTVARFIRDTALRAGAYKLKLVSLCMSSRDPTSLQLGQPGTWSRGASTCSGMWEGLPYTHVGAVLGELEFQRYRRRRVLREVLDDCDLIQVVGGCPAWAVAVTGLGKPVALQVATLARAERRWQNGDGAAPLMWWRRAMTRITSRFDDQALRTVSAIQVENQWMFDYARKINGAREFDLRYAPPGVNTVRFRPPEHSSRGRELYILAVGRLNDPRKNIDLLLDAYALLPRTLRGDVRLVLAGASGPARRFWNRAETLGLGQRITFHQNPSESQLVDLYQGAAVLAMPSLEEGLGMVILEAMACGVPVVSTRSGGPESIIDDGRNGFLTPLNEARSLADRVQVILKAPELRREMGKTARQTVLARFDERIAGAEFVTCWDRLINED